MIIDTNLLYTFLEIVKSGNLNTVSQKLQISQSALSQRVRALEEVVGASVFFRKKTGMELNKLGNQLFDICRELDGNLKKVSSWIETQKCSLSGEITISSISGAISCIFPGFLEHFLNKYRDLTVTIRENVSSVTEEEVLEGRVDLGVITGKCQKSSLKILQLIGDNSLLMVCSPDYMAKRKKLTAKDFNKEKIIWYSEKRSRGTKNICKHLGIAYHQEIGNIRLPDMQTCKLYALKGLGIAVLANMFVHEELKRGELVALQGFKMKIPVNLISRNDEYELPILAHFKAELLKYCRAL